MSHLALIFTSVGMGAVGQMLLKAGADRLGEYNPSVRHLISSIWTVVKIPQIFIGMFFFGFSFLLWIKVLTKSELSYAYPLVSFSYVIVAIGSAVFFNEPITFNKILGIGAIVVGVFILNR